MPVLLTGLKILFPPWIQSTASCHICLFLLYFFNQNVQGWQTEDLCSRTEAKC